MSGGLRLTAKASKGRLWFHADDLAGDRPEHGALVRVAAHDGRDLGPHFVKFGRFPQRPV